MIGTRKTCLAKVYESDCFASHLKQHSCQLYFEIRSRFRFGETIRKLFVEKELLLVTQLLHVVELLLFLRR